MKPPVPRDFFFQGGQTLKLQSKLKKIDIGLFRLTISTWMNFANVVFKQLVHFIQGVLFTGLHYPFVPCRVCSNIPCFIPDIGYLCFLSGYHQSCQNFINFFKNQLLLIFSIVFNFIAFYLLLLPFLAFSLFCAF